jgi:tetratricopeptide (TPR) repeat protein
MRREEFLRWWDRAGHWTLLVCPPNRMTWPLSADEHNDLGLYFEHAHRLTDAAQHYQAALDLRPDNPYFALNLGNALRKQGKLREAAAAFARAPGNADALNNHADILCELGEQLDEAAAMCRRAVELLPGHRAYYLDTLGSVLVKQGKKPEAITAYEQARAATTARQASLRAGIQRRLAAARALAEK